MLLVSEAAVLAPKRGDDDDSIRSAILASVIHPQHHCDTERFKPHQHYAVRFDHPVRPAPMTRIVASNDAWRNKVLVTKV